jgi:hypothetical protein
VNKTWISGMAMVCLCTALAHASSPKMPMQTGLWSYQIYHANGKEITSERDTECRSKNTDTDLWLRVNQEADDVDDCFPPRVSLHGKTIISRIVCTDIDSDHSHIYERTSRRYIPTAYTHHKITAYRSEIDYIQRTGKRTTHKQWITRHQWQGACQTNLPPN